MKNFPEEIKIKIIPVKNRMIAVPGSSYTFIHNPNSGSKSRRNRTARYNVSFSDFPENL